MLASTAMTTRAQIVLSTCNARYSHPSLGLRYLLANMGPLRARTRLIEYDLRRDVEEMATEILLTEPVVVGLGVYIWNVGIITRLARRLKERKPDILLVLGGPEVSHETEDQEVAHLADYVLRGEADLAFGRLCRDLLSGVRPSRSFLDPEPPDLAAVELPYDLYDRAGFGRRVVYVEASRGCPYRCEYCLSSLDRRVRHFPLEAVLAALRALLDRGALQFKFVDRTFNLNMARCEAIMGLFLERMRPGLVVQFEMVPDRLPERLRALLRRFPPGALRLELGVQTFDPAVARRVQRRQDYGRLLENFRFLHEHTHAVVHADLIAGLPGETLEGFARGFDRMLSLGPAEIQVGILKRLHGVPLSRHDQPWGMVYRQEPPYDLLRSAHLSTAEVERVKRFARFWERVWNSGRLRQTAPLLWQPSGSPFEGFMAFSDWLYARVGRSHGISLLDFVQHLLDFLVTVRSVEPTAAAATLARDYQRHARRALPRFLRQHLPGSSKRARLSVLKPPVGRHHPPLSSCLQRVSALNSGTSPYVPPRA